METEPSEQQSYTLDHELCDCRDCCVALNGLLERVAALERAIPIPVDSKPATGECPTCKGSGLVHPDGDRLRVAQCLTCNGSGNNWEKVIENPELCQTISEWAERRAWAVLSPQPEPRSAESTDAKPESKSDIEAILDDYLNTWKFEKVNTLVETRGRIQALINKAVVEELEAQKAKLYQVHEQPANWLDEARFVSNLTKRIAELEGKS